MRAEVSFYGHNPCPFCWPRKTRRTGKVLEIKPGWIKMQLDGWDDGDFISFDLTSGMTLRVLAEAKEGEQ